MNTGTARTPGWKKQRKMKSISKKNARRIRTIAGIVSLIFGFFASIYPGRAHWYDVGVDEILVTVQFCAIILSTLLYAYLLKEDKNKMESLLTFLSISLLIFNIVTKSSYLFVFGLFVMLITIAFVKDSRPWRKLKNTIDKARSRISSSIPAPRQK